MVGGINQHCLTHSETEEEAGLAHRRIADQEELEQVITIEGQANKILKKKTFVPRRGGNKNGGETYNSLPIALPAFDSKNNAEERGVKK